MQYKSSAVAEMGDRLATISSRLSTEDIGGKVGGACPLLGGAGSPSNTM